MIYILFMEDTHTHTNTHTHTHTQTQTHTHTHTQNVFDSALFIWNAYARMNQTKEHYHAWKPKCHATIKFKHFGYDVL